MIGGKEMAHLIREFRLFNRQMGSRQDMSRGVGSLKAVFRDVNLGTV